jgi:hypothetical protein
VIGVVLATSRDSTLFLIVGNRDFGEKKYPSVAFLIAYLNIVIFYYDFSLAKDRKQE